MNDSTASGFLFFSFLSLFVTLSALVFCALPALMASLGMADALARMVFMAPILVWVAQFKAMVFTGSAVLIGLSAFFLDRAGPSGEGNPVAGTLAFGWCVWCVALAVFTVGFFFAFFAPYILVM